MKNRPNINIANILTLSRIILGIIFLLLFLYAIKNKLSGINLLIVEIISIILFIIAIITDGLDGYFARKKNKITEFGKHFDPLSDSIFFIFVFFTFLILKLMPWYFFALILLREGFMHIFLRPYMQSKGAYLPANIYGKIKTVFQSVFYLIILTALIFKQILLILLFNEKIIDAYNSYLNIIAYIFFTIITFLSLFSLSIYIVYFKKNIL